MANRFMKNTVCGIDLSAFAQQPTPEELGQIVALWANDDQAKFFMWMGSKLKDSCGLLRDEIQCAAIGEAIEKMEMELYDGSASRLIRMLARGIKDDD